MAEKQADGPKKAPPRNDFKSSALYRNSRAVELQNRDPNFAYEYKTTADEHPHSLSKTGRLNDHEYGSQVGGFVAVRGWEPVQRVIDDRVKQVEAREDQGKPIDTLVRYGKQILCRIPRDEHEKYALADQAYQDAIQKQIYTPERKADGTTSMTAVVSSDPNADRMRMLRDNGHPVPGIS